MSEKCVNVKNMKSKEESVLFGDAKDFKSDDVLYIYIYRCWFITNVCKSDHRLNITLDTDIKFTLMLSIC